jgi:hypothetical protein
MVVVFPEVVDVYRLRFGGVKSISHVPAISDPKICSVYTVPAVTPYAVMAAAEIFPVAFRLGMVTVPVAFRFVVVIPDDTLRLVVKMPDDPVTFSLDVMVAVDALRVVVKMPDDPVTFSFDVKALADTRLAIPAVPVTLRVGIVMTPVPVRLVVVIPPVPVTVRVGVVTLPCADKLPTVSVLSLKKLVLDSLSNTFLDAGPSLYNACLFGGGTRARAREGCGVGLRITPGRTESPLPAVAKVKLKMGSRATLTEGAVLYPLRLSRVDMV